VYALSSEEEERRTVKESIELFRQALENAGEDIDDALEAMFESLELLACLEGIT
jgi:hypothetical protein